MAYVPKYQLKFNDQKDAAWVVSLCLNNYSGDIYLLNGSATPLTIRRDGDEDDIFDPIRTSKAIIGLYIKEADNVIYGDTDTITDKTFFVKIECIATGYLWEGWLIPDERSRPLRTDGYYLTLTAVDVFSLMKGKYYQNTNGELLLGKKSLLDSLYYSFYGALTNADQWAYRISHVISYDNASVDPASAVADVLHQVGSYAQAFLDSTGRSRKATDAVTSIMEVLGMYTFYCNGQLHFRSPVALTRDNVRVNYKTRAGVEGTEQIPLTKDINTKSFSDQGAFLLGNTENISRYRAAKEVSAKFEYGDLVSIIDNANFFGYNAGTEAFTGWDKLLDAWLTRVSREGKGRTYDPFVARLWGKTNPLFGPGITTGLFVGHSTRDMVAGNILLIKIRFRYYDYFSIPGWPQEYYRGFRFRISVTNGATTYYYYNINVSPSQINAGTGNSSENKWLPDPSVGGDPAQFCASFIDSSRSIQSVSFTTPKCPISGPLKIEISPITNMETIPANPGAPPAFAAAQNYIDIVSVNIGVQAQAGDDEIQGEIHYLTQPQDYSELKDTVDTELGDATTDTVGGALFAYTEPGMPLTQIWQNQIDGTRYPVLHMLVRMFMFFARFPKTRIECEIFSNDLFFDHLLLFRNGATTYLPGKYMQMTDEYDVKACRHKIVAVELAGKYNKEVVGDPSSDLYEFYYETSGGNN